MNRPVPFKGTEAEARMNRATHRWMRDPDGEVVCETCVCKPWHTVANYPCGFNVPREDV